MKLPQVENGYTRIANELLEELLKYKFPQHSMGNPLKICLFVIRKTYGYNKKKDRISLTQFEKAINASRPTVVHWLDYLVKAGLLVKAVEPLGSEYGLNKDYSKWVVKGALLVKARKFTSKGALTNTSKGALTHKRKKDITKETSDFDLFWDAYDKKADRSKCKKKWNKLKQEEKDKIMNTLPAYVLSTPDKQYRKNPSTYLNNKSWENEINIKSKDEIEKETINRELNNGKEIEWIASDYAKRNKIKINEAYQIVKKYIN